MADYKKLCAELLDVVVKRVDHTYGDNRLMKRECGRIGELW